MGRPGATGESIAVEYLRREGLEIICRNWRCEWGEIDIIAADGDTLVFVEVKSAHTNRFGKPQEWVDKQKKSHIIKSAMQYVLENHIGERIMRFDVVAVDFAEKRIYHIPDAFIIEGEI